MKLVSLLKSLYRSPLKSILTLLLLTAAAFLFLYNLSEYTVADKEYREARDKYEGVLTVEEKPVPDITVGADYFLLTDETGRTSNYGKPITADGLDQIYDNFHQQSLGEDLIEVLGNLSHISRVERRYLTAGVSPEYSRLDTDTNYYSYNARCILTATVKSRIFSQVHDVWDKYTSFYPELESVEYLIIEDVDLLAGDPAWLWDSIWQKPYEQFTVDIQTVKAEYKEKGGAYVYHFEKTTPSRSSMYTTENHVYPENSDILQPDRRYLMVLRNNKNAENLLPSKQYGDQYRQDLFHQFEVGDDYLADWWPYFVDITDLPENWLDSAEYTDLRELIHVTNDDIHTFDVVYGDDMAAMRRVSDNRMICVDGRFITPEDAGQPVCVVSTDFLDTYGLHVGDSITLDLGNYLSEQFAPLGAVAVTRGRQNTAYTPQTFTIIGTWLDLNEGNHPYRDLYWSWSNNAIFVPSAFLPECRNAEGHTFKPSEVSFVIGNAEEIKAFVEECLPKVESMGLIYTFSDGGWLNVAEDLMRARLLALIKLLIFTGAAIFAMILTVWLFISRKRREYGILRALGMPSGEASKWLFAPFLVLESVATVIGFLVARIVTAYQLSTSEQTHVSANLGLFLLGALGFLAFLAMMAFVGLMIIKRKSILELMQEKQK